MQVRILLGGFYALRARQVGPAIYNRTAPGSIPGGSTLFQSSFYGQKKPALFRSSATGSAKQDFSRPCDVFFFISACGLSNFLLFGLSQRNLDVRCAAFVGSLWWSSLFHGRHIIPIKTLVKHLFGLLIMGIFNQSKERQSHKRSRLQRQLQPADT